MAANYTPQIVQQVIASTRQATGIDVRYQGGMWEYTAGNGGTWLPFDAAGQASMHDHAARLAMQAAQKAVRSTPPQTPVQQAVSTIASSYGKSVAYTGSGWMMQDARGGFRPAGVNASTAFDAVLADANAVAQRQQLQQQAAQVQNDQLQATRQAIANAQLQLAQSRADLAAQKSQDYQARQAAKQAAANPQYFPGAYTPQQVQQFKYDSYSAANIAAHQQAAINAQNDAAVKAAAQKQAAQNAAATPQYFPGAYTPQQIQQFKYDSFTAAYHRTLANAQNDADAKAARAAGAGLQWAPPSSMQPGLRRMLIRGEEMAEESGTTLPDLYDGFRRRATRTAAAVGLSMYVSAHAASSAAGSLIEGASSVAQQAYDAGASIAGALLGGALGVFGKSGSAITSVAKTGLSAIGGIAQAGIGAAGSIGRGVAGVAGAGLALYGAGVGGMLGGTAGLIAGGISSVAGLGLAGPLVAANAAMAGMVIGAAIVAGVMRAVSGLASMINDVLQSVGKVIGEVGKVISAAISASIEIIQDVSKAALDQSKAILDLSQKSGLSLTQASQAITTGMAFGIGAGDIRLQNPLIGRVQASIYGGSGDGSPDDISAFRSWYRSLQSQGPAGLLLAQGLMPADKQPYVAAANLPDDIYQRQLSVSADLSMTPEAVERVGQEFKSLLDTASMLAQSIKTNLLEALLPALTDGLNFVVDYWTQNKEAIINTLWDVGRWIYVDLPVMVIGGLRILNDAGLAFAHQMADIGRFIAIQLVGVSNLFDAFANGQPTFLDGIRSFLQNIDFLSVGYNSLMKSLSSVGYAIYDIFAFLVNSFLDSITNLPADLLRTLGLTGVADSIQNFRLGYLDQNDLDVWDNATDLTGWWDNLQNSNLPRQISTGARDAAIAFWNNSNALDTWATNQHGRNVTMLDNAANSVADNGAKFDAYRDKVNAERTANATERTAAATEKSASALEQQFMMLMGQFERVIARAAAYQAEDAALNLMRVG